MRGNEKSSHLDQQETLQSSQQVFLKNKSVFVVFLMVVFFFVEKCFLVLFSSKCVFFFLYHAGQCRVLQFNIKISRFLGSSLINLL